MTKLQELAPGKRPGPDESKEEKAMTENAVVVPKAEASPEIKELAKRSKALVAAAKLIKVTNETNLESATQFMRGVKTVEREITAEIKLATDPLTAKINAYRKMGKDILALPAEAESIVDPLIARYRQKRREAQEKREAEERAEAERVAEEEKTRKIEELKAKGDSDSLELAEEVAEAPAPVVASGPSKRFVPKQDGASGKLTWKFDYDKVDMTKLILAAAADPKLHRFLQPNKVEIGKVVKAMEKDTAIPGVMVYSEESRTYKSL